MWVWDPNLVPKTLFPYEITVIALLIFIKAPAIMHILSIQPIGNRQPISTRPTSQSFLARLPADRFHVGDIQLVHGAISGDWDFKRNPITEGNQKIWLLSECQTRQQKYLSLPRGFNKFSVDIQSLAQINARPLRKIKMYLRTGPKPTLSQMPMGIHVA